MGCSRLSFHLHYNIHVVDNRKCKCGIDVGSIEHYYFSSPLYIRNRQKMLNEIYQLTGLLVNEITKDILLYGDKRLTFNTTCSPMCNCS